MGKLQAILAAPRAVPVLVRHLAAYIALAAEEATQATVHARRQLALGAVAGAAALLCVALVTTWLIASTWDGPWRLWMIGGLATGFGIAAVAAGLAATRGAPAPFGELRTQWQADRALLERAGLLDADDADAPFR